MKQEIIRYCPTCLGTGKIVGTSVVKYSEETRKQARKLKREGKTYREIGKLLGIDHPQKVYSLINSKSV